MPILSGRKAGGFVQPHGGDLKALAAMVHLDPGALIDFSANINPFGPPAEVLEAVLAAAKSIAAYPELNADSFINALGAGLSIKPDCLLPGNGSADLLYWFFSWLKPKRALIVEPGFADYRRAAEANRAEIVPFYLNEGDGFKLDPDLFEDALDSADAVVIGRPNNPTGGLVDATYLTELAARRPRIFFIIDEAFIDFVEPPVSIAHHAAFHKNLIVLRSLTKIFSVPGLRLGYLVSSAANISEMRRSRPPWPLGAAQIAAGCAAAALDGFVESSRRRLTAERHWLLARLEEIGGLDPLASTSNFILIRIMAPNTTSADLTISLAGLGVCVRDCRSFTGLGDRYIRVAVRSREENEMLVDALKEAL